MSAYRQPPPPPRWQLVYRLPLFERLRRSAMVTLFAAIVALGLVLAVVAPILGGLAALPFAAFGVMGALTAAVFLTIVWMTRLPETAVRTIARITGDARRCRVFSGGESWTLPVSAEKLRVGQQIRVRFREIAPESDEEPGREVIEVRAIED